MKPVGLLPSLGRPGTDFSGLVAAIGETGREAVAVDLVELVGDRGRLAVVDDAGHALLPEQPERLAEVVTGWQHEVDP